MRGLCKKNGIWIHFGKSSVIIFTSEYKTFFMSVTKNNYRKLVSRMKQLEKPRN